MKEDMRKLSSARIKPGEYERNIWVATVEQGTQRKDLEKPEFWANVSPKLKPYDKIEVRVDDGIFFAEYLVLASSRNWSKVKELMFVNLTSADVDMTEVDDLEGFEVAWKGPQLKWVVIRKSDKEIIKEGMLKDEANLWLREHVKTVA